MSFLYPYFLFALLAVSVPIIIHLFNFKRYKTIYFSNVELLKLIKKESKKKSQLKQLIILAARILAISSLVFAFSRPFIPYSKNKQNAPNQTVAIFIDNSFSMKAEGENGQLLEQAKQKAIEIANSYQASTQFMLLTCDFLPQHKFLYSKDQFINQISEVKESPRSPGYPDIYQSAFHNIPELQKKSRKTLYLISDFQKNKSGIESVEPDSTIFTYLLPLKSNMSNNLVIDSCWFEVPGRKIGQAEKLFVKISNTSEQAYQNIPVRLSINDSLKAVSNFNLSGFEKTVIELNYTNNSEGIQLCKIDLDDYPIIYDNTWYMSYRVRGKMQALGIVEAGNNSNYLNKMFLDDELISYEEFSQNNFQISRLKNYQCIFLLNNQKISSGLNQEIINFVTKGNSLAIFPSRNSDLVTINDFLTTSCGKSIHSVDSSSMGISEINYSHELYRDVFKKQESNADLPTIKGFFNFTDQLRKNETVLLKFRNGKPALSVHPLGEGKVYLFAFSLDRTNFNFIRHVLFLPTIYNIILNSGGQQIYAYTIDKDDPITLNQTDFSDKLSVINVKTKDEFTTQLRTIGSGKKQLILDDMTKEAGHYKIVEGNQAIQSISYNYSRNESNPEYYKEDDLKDLITSSKFNHFELIELSDLNFSETLRDLNDGKQLWKFFIGLAIFFIFCEMAVIRFWKS